MAILKFLNPTKKKLLIFFSLLIFSVIQAWFGPFRVIEVIFHSILSKLTNIIISTPTYLIALSTCLIAIYIGSCLLALKKWKGILIICLIVIIGLFIAHIIYFYIPLPWTGAQKSSSNKADDKLNMEIIKNKIGGEEDGHLIFSWNTKKYGRVYAQDCMIPNYLRPSCTDGCKNCLSCTDSGVYFYDREGALIASCGGMPGYLAEPGYSCDVLMGVDYKESDYFSDFLIQQCPKFKK